MFIVPSGKFVKQPTLTTISMKSKIFNSNVETIDLLFSIALSIFIHVLSLTRRRFYHNY